MKDQLCFEDIKGIFLQFKSLHKKIHELTTKKVIWKDYLLISVIYYF